MKKTTSALLDKPKPKQIFTEETYYTFQEQLGDTYITTEETEAKPERTGEILSFLKEINRINPQTTHTAKNAQPVLPRSPLLQYSDPLGYSAEDIVKSELTGDNIDLPYFCCIPCPIL
jgi:hypothetical protein